MLKVSPEIAYKLLKHTGLVYRHQALPLLQAADRIDQNETKQNIYIINEAIIHEMPLNIRKIFFVVYMVLRYPTYPLFIHGQLDIILLCYQYAMHRSPRARSCTWSTRLGQCTNELKPDHESLLWNYAICFWHVIYVPYRCTVPERTRTERGTHVHVHYMYNVCDLHTVSNVACCAWDWRTLWQLCLGSFHYLPEVRYLIYDNVILYKLPICIIDYEFLEIVYVSRWNLNALPTCNDILTMTWLPCHWNCIATARPRLGRGHCS